MIIEKNIIEKALGKTFCWCAKIALILHTIRHFSSKTIYYTSFFLKWAKNYLSKKLLLRKKFIKQDKKDFFQHYIDLLESALKKNYTISSFL